MGREVLSRFHLMPLLQLAMLTAFLLFHGNRGRLHHWLTGITAIAVSAVLGLHSTRVIGLANDSVIQDYSVNLLNASRSQKTSIIIVLNENAYFGIRYAQAVLQNDARAAVVIPSLFFLPWYLPKVQITAPVFDIPEISRVLKDRELNLHRDLILPNLQYHSIVVTTSSEGSEGYLTNFLGLGRRYQSGSGLSFDDASAKAIEINTKIEDTATSPQAFSKKLLYAEYSHFYLARGLNSKTPVEDFEEALKVVPYAFPALANLCQLKSGADPRCTKENLSRVRDSSLGIF
jgi:hypothetical protein